MNTELPELTPITRKLFALLNRIDPPEIEWEELFLLWRKGKRPANMRNRMVLAYGTRGLRRVIFKIVDGPRRRQMLQGVRREHQELVAEYMTAELICSPYLDSARLIRAKAAGGVQ